MTTSNNGRAARRAGLRPNRRQFMQGVAAIGITLPAWSRSARAEGQVNVYNWDTYIGEDTIADFEDATGVTVNYDLFADNAELFARFREGNPGYDVIVPTNDYVERMIVAGMLQELDHGKIPNFANIEPVFQDATFDPGRKYSIPYMWGTIGIGYRVPEVEGVPDSWKWLFDSDAYSGRIAILSEPTTVIGLVMKYLGYSLNSTNTAEIDEATELLIQAKRHIKAFAPDNGQDLLLSGEVDLVMEWNGDIQQVMAEDEEISYVVPKEGGMLWQDCMCIPKDAPNPDNAHAFINFVNEPEINAAIASFINYATPNGAAKALMPAEYLDNPTIFPPDEVLANCEFPLFLGQEHGQYIESAWTRIEAA
ncbi:MAG: spermidine/putrescine ABC transporter substrate-binding protein [Alphaproteobacteria bacterium]